MEIVACSDEPLLRHQHVATVRRADGQVVEQLFSPNNKNIIARDECMTWTCAHWDDSCTVTAEKPFVHVWCGAEQEHDFFVRRPRTQWSDAPAATSFAWSAYGRHNSSSTIALDEAAHTCTCSAPAVGPGSTPVLLLVTAFPSSLPSVVSAIVSANVHVECRIIHLDGSKRFATFSAGPACDAYVYDVGANGAPVAAAEDACTGKKAIEIVAYVSTTPADVLVTVRGLSPPGLTIVRARSLRSTFVCSTPLALQHLAELMGCNVRSMGSSDWGPIRFTHPFIQKMAETSTITVYVERQSPDKQGDDTIILQHDKDPCVRLRRYAARIDILDIDVGSSCQSSANRMRITARGAHTALSKFALIHMTYKPNVITFTDRDKTSHGITIVPRGSEIRIPSSTPIKSIIPDAFLVQLWGREKGGWETHAEYDRRTLGYHPQPEQRTRAIDDDTACCVRIARASTDAMTFIHRSVGLCAEAYVPFECAHSPTPTAAAEDDAEKKRRRVEPTP